MISILPPSGPGQGWNAGAVSFHWIPALTAGEESLPELTVTAPTGASLSEEQENPLQILIIEDNRDYADGLQTVFEILGHAATATYNGLDGLKAALHQVPDVIVCDIGLPGVDGYEIARTLRQNPATASILLVAVSGYASDADRELAHQSGFNAHVAKPADASAILSLILSKRRKSS